MSDVKRELARLEKGCKEDEKIKMTIRSSRPGQVVFTKIKKQ